MVSSLPMLLSEIPEEEQQHLLERFARSVVRRQLAAPVILFLEMCKPLNFLGSQILLALDPFVRSLFPGLEYRKFALIIEQDQNVETLIRLIETYSTEQEN